MGKQLAPGDVNFASVLKKRITETLAHGILR